MSRYAPCSFVKSAALPPLSGWASSAFRRNARRSSCRVASTLTPSVSAAPRRRSAPLLARFGAGAVACSRWASWNAARVRVSASVAAASLIARLCCCASILSREVGGGISPPIARRSVCQPSLSAPPWHLDAAAAAALRSVVCALCAVVRCPIAMFQNRARRPRPSTSPWSSTSALIALSSPRKRCPSACTCLALTRAVMAPSACPSRMVVRVRAPSDPSGRVASYPSISYSIIHGHFAGAAMLYTAPCASTATACSAFLPAAPPSGRNPLCVCADQVRAPIPARAAGSHERRPSHSRMWARVWGWRGAKRRRIAPMPPPSSRGVMRGAPVASSTAASPAARFAEPRGPSSSCRVASPHACSTSAAAFSAFAARMAAACALRTATAHHTANSLSERAPSLCRSSSYSSFLVRHPPRVHSRALEGAWRSSSIGAVPSAATAPCCPARRAASLHACCVLAAGPCRSPGGSVFAAASSAVVTLVIAASRCACGIPAHLMM